MDEPLVFQPIVKNNVWGGEFLRARSKSAPAGPLGESWEIADHDADTTVAIGGKYAGKSLHELVREVCGEALDPASPEVFPLLLKIIDPLDDLSVQVHPDDDYAGKQKAGELGKTEAWYILSAKEGGKVYRGLKPGTTPEMFAEAVQNGTCAQLLKEVPVKAGDVVFLPSGTIHALCGGVRIAEIQQNSDTTYRVFDWNRVGLDGKPRALHVEHAARVSDFSDTTGHDLCRPAHLPTANCLHESYVMCEKFAFEKISRIGGPVEMDTHGRTFHILTVLKGRISVSTKGGEVSRGELDSVLIPAGAGRYEVSASTDAEFLLFYRPV